MRNVLLIVLFVLVPFSALAEIVKQVNPDGSITYVNVYEGPPKKAPKENPNVGDLVDGVKIYDISTKKIKTSSDYVYVGVKVKVQNYSEEQDIQVKVECLDSSGFQLDYTWVDGLVRHGDIGYLTTQMMIEKPLYSKIKEWRIKP